MAIEAGSSAVASTFGVLGSVARQYAHKIPFIVKFTHNELLTYPKKNDQIRRELVYRTCKAAGMPTGVLNAYEAYLENLKVYNCVA